MQETTNWEEQKDGEEVIQLPLKDLRANPYHPRYIFDEEALEDLANSIKQVGIFQPIIVRKSQIKGYEIIAGERRFRATKLAGLQEIPAIIRQISDEEMMQIAVLENLQRENLTPLEEAKSCQTLMANLQITQQELSEKIGKSRSYIANYLRLFQLPQVVQQMVDARELTDGQVRPLITLKTREEQEQIARMIKQNNWSARQVEEYVKKDSKKNRSNNTRKQRVNILYEEIERQLSDKFGTIVNVVGETSGKIEIQFLSKEDLTHIIDKLDIQID